MSTATLSVGQQVAYDALTAKPQTIALVARDAGIFPIRCADHLAALELLDLAVKEPTGWRRA